MTTSKTRQFSETFSIFEFDNIQNEAILGDILQKWKVECSADGLVPMRFAIFPPHLSKVLRLPRKIDARSYEVLHNHLSKPTDLMLQNATPLRKSAPGPPNSSDEHVSCIAPATENASLQILFNVPRLPSFLKMRQNPHVLLTFDKVHNPLRLPRKTTSEPPKVALACGVLYILTSTCASCHNGVHFFDISTSKSGPTLVCFVHFDFETCFSPQLRAFFRHHNFQKWSEHEVFFPTCQVRVVRFYVSCLLLLSSPLLSSSPLLVSSPLLLSSPPAPCRTSTTTIHAQCALPDLNHDHHRPVSPAGPQPRVSPPSVLNHDHPRPVFPAGPQPRPSSPSVPCRTSTTTIHAQCFLPDLNRDFQIAVGTAGPQRQECQKRCQIECQKICQKECQKICQTECQKICQKECQKICQIECQKICQIKCQKICQIECQTIECQKICQKICQIDMPEDMPDRMPEDMSEYMPERYAR